ncbi:MAG TPA: hypothetical protein VH477_01615 [Bryobacteraceae bacterium]
MRCYFNLLALNDLEPPRDLEDIKRAGYDGVQYGPIAPQSFHVALIQLGLEYAASGRVDGPEEAEVWAATWSMDACRCGTLHVGSGLESQTEACRLIESILKASEKYKVPLYVETHRATIFQDMWRTVEFVRQFPELRFNGDFSHWYTGQEMVYGGFEDKFEFIRPVLERVRFLHGRIGNPGCIQVALDPQQQPEPEYVGHFRRLWTECFRHGAEIFTPELLAPGIYYARTLPGGSEESDRWEQSLVLRRIAEECYAEAHR